MEEDYKEVNELVAAESGKAASIVVSDQASYDGANAILKDIKAATKKVEDFFEPMRVSAKAAYDSVLEKKRLYIEPLKSLDANIRQKMSVYATEQEKIRQEQITLERDRLQKEAEELALRVAEEQVAMGRAKDADKTLEDVKISKKQIEEAAPLKVGKTMTVWKVEVVSKEQFLTYLVSNDAQDFLNAVSISIPELSRLLKARNITDLPGLSIEQIQRPIL
jgi:hypothetical protein